MVENWNMSKFGLIRFSKYLGDFKIHLEFTVWCLNHNLNLICKKGTIVFH